MILQLSPTFVVLDLFRPGSYIIRMYSGRRLIRGMSLKIKHNTVTHTLRLLRLGVAIKLFFFLLFFFCFDEKRSIELFGRFTSGSRKSSLKGVLYVLSTQQKWHLSNSTTNVRMYKEKQGFPPHTSRNFAR